MTDALRKENNVKTIRELLGLEDAPSFTMPGNVAEAPTAPAPMLDLPVAETEEEIIPADIIIPEPQPFVEERGRLAGFLSKDWVRYPLIFMIAVGFFYIVFNFSSLTEQFFGAVNPPEPNEEVVLGPTEALYLEWIGAYYIVVNNPQTIAANSDPDGDGLTNLDEYYMQTNPLRRDTDRDGADDASEVIDGANPLYDGGQTDAQVEVVATRIDLTAVESRRAYQSQIAGETTAPFVVDAELAGEIFIPRLEIAAPVIWSDVASQMEEDLKNGAAHHPETPYPGEYGTASIHGHSSGNFNDGDYQTLFAKVNLLEPGDEVFVTVYATDGRTRKYRFVVRSEQIYAKDDAAQFNAGDGYFLNLSTSWPIGTARQRYVVTTELTGL